METFSPIRGMYVCLNDTGDFVKKSDYDALAAENERLREALEKMRGKAEASVNLCGDHEENDNFKLAFAVMQTDAEDALGSSTEE